MHDCPVWSSFLFLCIFGQMNSDRGLVNLIFFVLHCYFEFVMRTPSYHAPRGCRHTVGLTNRFGVNRCLLVLLKIIKTDKIVGNRSKNDVWNLGDQIKNRSILLKIERFFFSDLSNRFFSFPSANFQRSELSSVFESTHIPRWHYGGIRHWWHCSVYAHESRSGPTARVLKRIFKSSQRMHVRVPRWLNG
jgi:hypothetical protein